MCGKYTHTYSIIMAISKQKIYFKYFLLRKSSRIFRKYSKNSLYLKHLMINSTYLKHVMINLTHLKHVIINSTHLKRMIISSIFPRFIKSVEFVQCDAFLVSFIYLPLSFFRYLAVNLRLTKGEKKNRLQLRLNRYKTTEKITFTTKGEKKNPEKP